MRFPRKYFHCFMNCVVYLPAIWGKWYELIVLCVHRVSFKVVDDVLNYLTKWTEIFAYFSLSSSGLKFYSVRSCLNVVAKEENERENLSICFFVSLLFFLPYLLLGVLNSSESRHHDVCNKRKAILESVSARHAIQTTRRILTTLKGIR